MTSALSRRTLLGSLAASLATPGGAIAQGACRDGYGQGRCPLPVAEATAPINEVFDSTGWKTVALESFTMDVADYRREAAFYAALLGWRLRDDDGRQAGAARGRAQLCLGDRQLGCAQSGGGP